VKLIFRLPPILQKTRPVDGFLENQGREVRWFEADSNILKVTAKCI